METGTELFEDYAQAYQSLVQVCDEKSVTRDLPKIQAEFAQNNSSWRDTRVKVPNDTWNVESVQTELDKYEQKYAEALGMVVHGQETLSAEPTPRVDEKVALSEWQKVRVSVDLLSLA